MPLVLAGRRCRRRRRIGFLQRLGTFLAADFDGRAAELDADRVMAEFAVAGGACGFLHRLILRWVSRLGQDHKTTGGTGLAVEFFSDLSRPDARRALEFCRALAIGLAERGSEVAVARKAELEAERGQIVVLAEKIERPGKA